ncbi:MAG: hypothetical protein AB1656_04975 [Candidatus Omnitrophota bacterium]
MAFEKAVVLARTTSSIESVRLSLFYNRVSKNNKEKKNTYLKFVIAERLWKKELSWPAGTKIEVECDADDGSFKLSHENIGGFKLCVGKSNKGSAHIIINIRCFSEKTRQKIQKLLGKDKHDLKCTVQKNMILCNL